MSHTTSKVAEEPGANTGDGENTDDSGYQGNVKKIKYHCEDLEKIFKDDEDDGGLAGGANIDLAISFVHARYKRDGNEFMCRDEDFSRNAGALQLYNKDGTKYVIKGKESKEYNCVSKPYKKEGKVTNYGHSERRLMMDVLNDIRVADGKEPYFKINDDSELEKLTNNAKEYREYLKKNGVIVKMWSERDTCEKKMVPGGKCMDFLEKICPKGSKFGYLVHINAKRKKTPGEDFGTIEKAIIKPLTDKFAKQCINYILKKEKEEAKRKHCGTNQEMADVGDVATEDEVPGPSSEKNAQAKRSATDDNCPSESKVPKMSHDEGEGL